MRKNCGIFAGMNFEAVKKSLCWRNFFLTAYADEEKNEEAENNNNPDESGDGKKNSINFEDLITRARKEEKDKQYKEIQKWKDKVSTLTEQHNSDLMKVAELEKKVESAEKKLVDANKGDSDEVKTLKSEVENLKTQNADFIKAIDQYKEKESKQVSREELEKEIREELEKEYSVKNHRIQILADHKDDLLVPELVMGSTVEELDKSLEQALARSEEIRKKVGGGASKKGESEKKTSGTKTVKSPASRGKDFDSYSVDDILSMDPRSEEYKEFRKKMGLH